MHLYFPHALLCWKAFVMLKVKVIGSDVLCIVISPVLFRALNYHDYGFTNNVAHPQSSHVPRPCLKSLVMFNETYHG